MFELEAKLALANIDTIARGRVLIIGFPSAELVRAVADRADEVVVFQHDLRAHRAVDRAGVDVRFGAWTVRSTDDDHPLSVYIPGDVTTALVLLPKETERLRMTLAMVRPLLGDGGRVVLVGHNNAGIRSAAHPLREAIGPAEVLDYRYHCRAYEARAQGDATAFDPRAWARAYTATIRNASVEVRSYPGVFSHGRVDPATQMLLETIDMPPGARVLDVGCGSGVLAASLAIADPATTVGCVDVDAVALAATQETLGANGVDARARVWPSDVFSDVGETFSHIVCNPPFHAGVRTTHQIGRRLIEEAPARLERGGELWLVANRFLDYLTPLEAAFGSVEVRAEDSKYRVYRARR